MRVSPQGSSRSLSVVVLGAALALCSCKAHGDQDIVTRTERLRPAPARMVASAMGAAPSSAPSSNSNVLGPEQFPDADRGASSAFCRQVERQARDTNAGLPKDLDRDTRATRVMAYGCDVILEYAMLDMSSDQVAVAGVTAMRDEVVRKLCSDGGARGVLDHGGSFTSVYRDDRSALIDQFTVAVEDCSELRPQPDQARVGL
jgi:hypothetical protein